MDLVADGRATDGLPAPDNLEAAQLSPLPVVTRIEGRHATVPPPGDSAVPAVAVVPSAAPPDGEWRAAGGTTAQPATTGSAAPVRPPIVVRE
jgi:hypothetical protein